MSTVISTLVDPVTNNQILPRTWTSAVVNESGKDVETLMGEIKCKKISISLPTASWTGSASPYSQVITVTGSTVNSKIDLQADAALFQQMLADGCTALYVDNDNNTLTAYAVGNKLSVDKTVQGTISEVVV